MKPVHILVAEDDDNIRTGLVDTLESEGYRVTPARDGKQAIDLFSSGGFDLLLLDIMMPEVDGIMVLKKIRQLEAQKGLNPETRSKIIMTTALSEKSHVLAAAQANCNGFLVKPIDRARLFDEIRKLGFDIPE